MFLKFTYLQWKSFFRGEDIGVNVLTKVFKWFWIIYFTIMAPMLGFLTVIVFREDGEVDPFPLLNKNLIYVLIYLVVIRYFIQKVPVISVRPLLLSPISKSKIVRYALNKTIFSFYNVVVILYLVFLNIALISDIFGEYELQVVSTSFYDLIGWNLMLISLIYITNYLNFLLDKKDKLVYIIGAILASVKALEYYEIVDLTEYTQPLFYAFYTYPFLSIAPICLLIYLYVYVFKFFRKGLYIDSGLKPKIETSNVENFEWVDRFGDMAVFIKNDIRLIKRSKRARGTVTGGAFVLLYGFLFYLVPDWYEFFQFFGYMFVSGGFLFLFGSFVPSWDSQYYSLMMCQNIPYINYIKSKWMLVVIATALSTLLGCVIYSFVGLNAVCAVLAGGLYNIGANGYLTLWAGAYTKTPIDLNSAQNPFGDTKAINAKTLLISIPQMILPIALFGICNNYYGWLTGCAAVASIGILGILLKNVVFELILKAYKSEKYSTLKAYSKN